VDVTWGSAAAAASMVEGKQVPLAARLLLL
jgi:hypothetical protein